MRKEQTSQRPARRHRVTNSPDVPTLIVLHDRGSATPATVKVAARGICEPVFLCDLSNPRVVTDLGAVPRSTRVIDISGMSIEQVCAAAAELRPKGVITFSDTQLRRAASVASFCGLPFHDELTAELLVDKKLQRQALSRANVQSTACFPLRTAEDISQAVLEIGMPAVLKPRFGAGSIDTCLVQSQAELTDRYVELTKDGRGAASGYVLEPYLKGDPEALGPFWGDYVSVESLVHDGEVHTVTMTGKLQMAPPFRETGMFVPAAVPQPLVNEVLRLEHDALRALGIRHGVTHTEIKFTRDGPRVIEVNGRMGGHIADPLKRAGGVNLLASALRLAMGQCDPPAPLLPNRLDCPRVAFQFLLTPPDEHAVPGDTALLDELATLPGITLVDAKVDPNWRPDWRAGTEWLLGTVYGTTPDHQALHDTVKRLQKLTVRFWTRQPHATR